MTYMIKCPECHVYVAKGDKCNCEPPKKTETAVEEVVEEQEQGEPVIKEEEQSSTADAFNLLFKG